MNTQQALSIFDALSQETRLNAFRLLVEAGPKGLAAGIIGARLGIAHNTLSFHLSHLMGSGIISSRKHGRSIVYSANFMVVRGLIGYLVKDCCSPEFASLQENYATGCSVIKLFGCCQTESETILLNRVKS